MTILQAVRSLALILSFSLAAAAERTLVYPRAEAPDDQRPIYPVALLNLAFAKTGADYALQASQPLMQQGRAIRELTESKGVDVMWTMTSREREAQMLPIRIPILKGLMGWRIALVRAEQTELFAQTRTLRDLQRFVAGQGHDWPDNDILRANGVRVQTSIRYESLFKMLRAGRFDFFPRSVVEINDEINTHRDQHIAMEPHVLIHYPTAIYFFVRKSEPALAETISKGLELAIADGSFDRLFLSHYGDLLAQIRKSRRHVIELANPGLPPETPLDRKSLWQALD